MVLAWADGSMNLPLRLSWEMAQDRWSTILSPLLNSLLSQGNLLTDVELVAGTNVINHKLGRKQIGFMITDRNAAVQYYRSAPLNDKTLTLAVDVNATVSIWVF